MARYVFSHCLTLQNQLSFLPVAYRPYICILRALFCLLCNNSILKDSCWKLRGSRLAARLRQAIYELGSKEKQYARGKE